MIIMLISAMENSCDKAFILNLYNDYYGLVRKIIYSITHDVDHMEDLINDTFIKLIEKNSLIQTLDSCKMTAYIVYTTKSVAINFIKHRDVRKKHEYYGKDQDVVEEIPNFEDAVADQIVRQEEINELVNAIMELPDKQKDMLYFKYVLEIKDRDIAECFNISPDSVRQYLTRARRKAKELMDKGMSAHDK